MFPKSLETSQSAQRTRYAGHRPAQAQEEPAEWGALSQFLSGVTESFCKIKSKFLSFRVLAGGFVMGRDIMQKSLGFKQI